MLIRLGYACVSKTLENVTSSSPFTYTEFLKDHNYEKLKKIIISNLLDLDKIIEYNIKNNIHFFRLSSKIIPLATKPDVDFDYKNLYQSYYDLIGTKIRQFNMRVDFHPDQYCILNSTKKDVVKNSIEILKYHYNILEYLNIYDKRLIIHIGSSVLGKENSLKRFINNFNKLPDYIKKSITIENDDKVFGILDCIKLNEILNIPITLDYHHFICNNNGEKITELLPIIFESWKDETPKIHFSTSKNKSKKDFRSHHDYINSDDFISFVKILKTLNKDVDIMIEAKAKDEALFRLIRELKYKTNFKFVDETSFIV